MAATTIKISAALEALALVLLASLAPAEAMSTLTVWQNIGCTGPSDTFNGCGTCFNLTKYGGYEFKYDGEALDTYSSYDCENPWGRNIANDFMSCGGIKFEKSIKLQCPEGLHATA